MSFRLVPNSVTSDDLEWRNSPNRRVIGWLLVRITYKCMTEDTPIYFLQRKCMPKKNLVFSNASNRPKCTCFYFVFYDHSVYGF